MAAPPKGLKCLKAWVAGGMGNPFPPFKSAKNRHTIDLRCDGNQVLCTCGKAWLKDHFIQMVNKNRSDMWSTLNKHKIGGRAGAPAPNALPAMTTTGDAAHGTDKLKEPLPDSRQRFPTSAKLRVH